MKRSASLDCLRGAAAFAVAIPHYLTANAPFQPFAEAFAIAGVEVFFVLSGFVLAPQIVDWVVSKPWRNLGVFLVRRWMPRVASMVSLSHRSTPLFSPSCMLQWAGRAERSHCTAPTVDCGPERRRMAKPCRRLWTSGCRSGAHRP